MKTIKGIFHSLGGSSKPKLLKISNFRHKIELFHEYLKNLPVSDFLIVHTVFHIQK